MMIIFLGRTIMRSVFFALLVDFWGSVLVLIFAYELAGFGHGLWVIGYELRITDYEPR
jgi:hypothetical protein